jgi:hypothetical protein
MARIDILLNLKYSDLSKPLAKQQINDNEVQTKNNSIIFTNIIKTHLFCVDNRSILRGCKCEPQCLWIDKWVKSTKEPKWTDDGRIRD